VQLTFFLKELSQEGFEMLLMGPLNTVTNQACKKKKKKSNKKKCVEVEIDLILQVSVNC
jgi:hypothetical protein